MKDGLGLFVEEQFSGVAKLVQSLKRFPGSGEPGHSASVIALREEKFLKESGIASQEIADPTKNFFDYIAEDEKRVARFRSAMGLSTQSAAFSSSYFIKSLPWADRSQCPETVVDIAGAGGELAEACKKDSFRANSRLVWILLTRRLGSAARLPKREEGSCLRPP